MTAVPPLIISARRVLSSRTVRQIPRVSRGSCRPFSDISRFRLRLRDASRDPQLPSTSAYVRPPVCIVYRGMTRHPHFMNWVVGAVDTRPMRVEVLSILQYHNQFWIVTWSRSLYIWTLVRKPLRTPLARTWFFRPQGVLQPRPRRLRL